MNKCCIVGAGEVSNLRLPENAYIIAADGGYEKLKNIGITPHLAVGDFDSLGRIPSDCETVVFPAKKDDTDILLAAKEGEKRGCTEFHIYGALGGRLDHTLGNIQIAAKLSKSGFTVYLYGDTVTVTAVTDGCITFDKSLAGTVSVFALEKCSGVTIKNLAYELKSAELYPDFPLGISNAFLGKDAFIEVKSGTLCIMYGPEKD